MISGDPWVDNRASESSNMRVQTAAVQAPLFPPWVSCGAAIQTEELKVKKSIKDAAKKGQKDVCKILAKELVQSRKAVSKLYASKAQMNSVVMSMQQQQGKLGRREDRGGGS